MPRPRFSGSVTNANTRAALFFAGVGIWSAGLIMAVPALRWVGIVTLMAAFLLRFRSPKQRNEDVDRTEEDSSRL